MGQRGDLVGKFAPQVLPLYKLTGFAPGSGKPKRKLERNRFRLYMTRWNQYGIVWASSRTTSTLSLRSIAGWIRKFFRL